MPSASPKRYAVGPTWSAPKKRTFLEQFQDKARQAVLLNLSEIRHVLEEKLGHKTALATTCIIVHRHGWRKWEPDKQHPKAEVQAREDEKKSPTKPRRNQPKLAGERKARPA